MHPSIEEKLRYFAYEQDDVISSGWRPPSHKIFSGPTIHVWGRCFLW